MTDELSTEEQRLSELLDEFHAPASMSYLVPRSQGGFRPRHATEGRHRGIWRGRAATAAVTVAVVAAVTGGYFGLRAARQQPVVPISGHWHVVVAPGGPAHNAIACASTTDCWAVGSRIEHYAGAGWTKVRSPTPAGGALAAITCRPAPDCWAVGAAPDGSATTLLIEHYTGSGWQRLPGPQLPPEATGGVRSLDGVACTDSTDCWAVGMVG